jgi:hypothetical protein
MSVPSFYRVVWKCIDAINACDELAVKFPKTRAKVQEAARGFKTIRTQGCIWKWDLWLVWVACHRDSIVAKGEVYPVNPCGVCGAKIQTIVPCIVEESTHIAYRVVMDENRAGAVLCKFCHCKRDLRPRCYHGIN